MRYIQVILANALSAALLGCSTTSSHLATETVTQDSDRPNRIRFVVHGDPGLKRYPEIDSMPLKMHEKIREGMRRYAEDELRVRGLCPNGFTGPEAVLASENARLTSRFWVDCL